MKACKDCQFYGASWLQRLFYAVIPPQPHAYGPRCMHPDAKLGNANAMAPSYLFDRDAEIPVNPVTGARGRPRIHRCFEQRAPYGACGPDALHFISRI